MTNKTTMQKRIVCIALIVLLFAFVAVLAVAGLVAPATQTASAEPQSGEVEGSCWKDSSTRFARSE